MHDLPFFKEIISPILRKLRGKETNIKFNKNCNAIEYNFTDYNLFNFMALLGFPIGKKGNKLFIPKVFYEKNLIEDIIQGFFATDGSIVLTKNGNKYYPRLEAHVISKDLVYEIYNYLIHLGFKGHFYQCQELCAKAQSVLEFLIMLKMLISLLKQGAFASILTCKRTIDTRSWKKVFQQYRFQFNGKQNLIHQDLLFA